MCRWGCFLRQQATPVSPWPASSPGSWTCWAATAWPRPITRRLALIDSGVLRPQELIERVISLDEAAALLPVFDRASPAGMTMIDPQRV